MPAIEVKNLVKSFRKFRALDGLNFKVEEGEIHGYLGPNGAGKTTTIRIIMGLLDFDSGDALVFGESSDKGDFSVMSRIGYMPELPSFPNHLKAEEILDIYGEIYGLSKEERKSRSQKLLELVGLKNYSDKKIGEFSKGMQQRFGIAQSLISDPYLLILDEPTAGLDPGGRVRIRNLVKEIGEQGVTVFISSHFLEEIEKICSHATIINEGTCLRSGPIEEISNLHEGMELRIEVQGLDESILSSVKDLEQVRFVEMEDSILTIITEESDDAKISLSETITQNGGIITEMVRKSRTLEDAFLEVTEGGEENGQVR